MEKNARQQNKMGTMPMTRLIVSTYDDNGAAKFGLFYDDSGDLYQEDWKPVLFYSEDEAKKKLIKRDSWMKKC